MSYIDRARGATRHLAFLLAGLSAALAGALILTGSIVLESKGQIADPFGLFVLSFIVASVACFAAGVFIALPVAWILEASRRESLRNYILAGFVVGSFAAIPVLLGGLTLPHDIEEILTAICGGGAPGALSGWVWWRLYRRHAGELGQS